MNSQFPNSEMAQFPGGLEEETADVHHDEYALKWAAVQRLPTLERITAALFDEQGKGRENRRVVNVRKLGAQEKRIFIDRLINHIEDDNLRLLQKLRHRIDNVGVELPSVEVRYNNVCIEADCQIVHGKPLPTVWNSFKQGRSYHRARRGNCPS